MDITLPKQNVCVEVDGPGHFQTMWYGPHKGTFLRDIQKMKSASENGFSGIRMHQANVLADKTLKWKEWLNRALAYISECDEPTWVFPLEEVTQYTEHIEACRDVGIKSQCI
jgi:hypothetical protein